MSGEEHATGARFGPFPSSWGIPRGAANNPERTEWVRSSIVRHEITGAGSAPLQLLLHKRGKLRALLRVADLERRREGP